MSDVNENDSKAGTVEESKTVDFSSKIKLEDGKEVSVSELIEKAKSADELKEATRTILEADDDGERERAARKLMEKNGWSKARIDAHFAALSQGDEGDGADAETEEAESQPRGRKQEGRKKTAAELRVEELERRINQIDENARSARATQLQSTIRNSIGESLENEPEVATFMKAALRDRSEQDSAKVLDIFAQAVEERTVRNLKALKEKTGKLRDDWVREETIKAAKAEMRLLGAVIADPSRFGRTAETEAGFDYTPFLAKKPLDKPKVKRGADNQAAASSYISDRLMRAASSLVEGADD